MTQRFSDKDPTPDSANIRSKEERYGGEGHAGEDPFAKNPGSTRLSPVEVPNADLEDLVERPAPAEDRRNEKGTNHGS